MARRLCALTAMLAGLLVYADATWAAFGVVPAVSKPGVLLRFVGRPSAALERSFVGYRVLRDGQAIGDVMLSPSAAVLAKLKAALFTNDEWTLLVKETNQLLEGSRYPTTSDIPEDWFKAVTSAPSIAQGLELENWKAAVMLSRAFLDASPPSGVHTYEVLGLVQSGRLITTVTLTEIGPFRVDTRAQTVVNPPPLWNVTPPLAHVGLAAKRAVTTPPDGADDPSPAFLPVGALLHTLVEKAHGQVYLKLAPPQPPLLLPGVFPGPAYLAFGYDVERAPAVGTYASTPPPANSTLWQRINEVPVLIINRPTALPDTPPPAVLEALKAEITDSAAAGYPGATLDEKKINKALENWERSRTRFTASTFRNTDFDFADGGKGLAAEDVPPDPSVWGPGVRYWYRVRGRNGVGEPGQPSPVIRCRPFETYRPLPPRDVTASKIGPNQTRVTWLPPAEQEGAIWKKPAAYRVYRWKERPGYPGAPVGPSNPAGPGKLAGVVPAGTTTFNDIGQAVGGTTTPLQQGAVYWYRVVSVDDADPPNESLPSEAAWAVMYDEEAPAPPGTPHVRGKEYQYNKCRYMIALPSKTPDGRRVSAQIPWASSSSPYVVGYLVYRALAVVEKETGCPTAPGLLEFVGEVSSPNFDDLLVPTDSTMFFYGVRAMDKDRNLSDLALMPVPTLISGSQPPPEPGFVGAQAVGPETLPGPWEVRLQWDASVPKEAYYQYELWRAEVAVTDSMKVPDDVPASGNPKLLPSGTTADPLSSLPMKYTDTSVAPGPGNLPTDYWYVVVLKDPSGLYPPSRSKAQYAKVGGDVLEPEHKLVPFRWASPTPIESISDASGVRVVLRWQEFPWEHLSWVDPTKGISSVLAAEAQVTGIKQERNPVEYVVFRSASRPDANFRQVSPLIRQWTWTDRDVLAGRSYHYQILAFDHEGTRWLHRLREVRYTRTGHNAPRARDPRAERGLCVRPQRRRQRGELPSQPEFQHCSGVCGNRYWCCGAVSHRRR
ncbi:MAG: fibronectin type III domain-containing protein [Armatimonadota bacterium]